MLAGLVTETTNAIVAAIKGADDVLTALRTAVKGQITGTFKDVTDVGTTGMDSVAAIDDIVCRRRAVSESSPCLDLVSRYAQMGRVRTKR